MLTVSLCVSESNGKMNIELSNNFSRDKDIQVLNSRIKDIEHMLSEPLSGDRARGEGGTGYFKIQKILRSDLGCKDFNIVIDPVDTDRIFKVKLCFDVKHLRQ